MVATGNLINDPESVILINDTGCKNPASWAAESLVVAAFGLQRCEFYEESTPIEISADFLIM